MSNLQLLGLAVVGLAVVAGAFIVGGGAALVIEKNTGKYIF
jgi:hypothetical protein